MQLTQFTDYSLRVLMYVAIKQEMVTTTEVAERYGISRHHIVKIIHKLGQLNYLETVRGPQGGIRLARLPEQINLGQLVVQIEPNFDIVECFNPQNNHCIINPICKLKRLLAQAKKAFIDTLSQHTLADAIDNRDELRNALSLT